MKKFVYILLGICTVFSSCLFNEEDKFPESSSFRVEKLNADCQETLVSAPNGWVMEYYPNTKEYGSYLIHMSFTNQNVIMTSATDLTKSEKSMYIMKASNGAELSFDTYNSILHMYSDPNLNNSFDGVGYGGDYEFMVVSVSDDLITLRGSKTGTLVYMHRLATDQSFKDYIDASKEMTTHYYAKNLQPDWIVSSGEKDVLYLRMISEGRISVSGENDFPVSDLENMAVAFRPNSIFINPGIKFGDSNYKEFIVNENKLVAKDNASVAINGGNFGDFFSARKGLSYKFQMENVSGKLNEAIQTLTTQITSRFSAHNLQFIALTNDRSVGFALLVKTSKTTSRYGIDMSFDKTTDQFTISVSTEDRFDKNGSLYMEKGITAYKDVINALAGIYSYSTEDPFFLNQVHLVKTDGTIDVVITKELIK